MAVDYIEGMEYVYDENGNRVMRRKGGDPNDTRVYYDIDGNRLPNGPDDIVDD